MQTLTEKVGVIHVHSVFSDGSGHYDEIIRSASEIGLDYLLFSDHWTLEPKKHQWEGFERGVLVGIGCELNDRDQHNHLLAFEIDDEIQPGLSAIEYTRKVAEAGGWAVIAHPDERRSSMKQFPPYPWTAWESVDFHGIELWNHLSEWMERINPKNKYWLYINPRRSIIAPTPWTLETWDKLNLKRKVVGIGGVDAHAHHYPIWKNVVATIFPYKVAFRSIHVHVLYDDKPVTNDSTVALRQLFKHLRSGRVYISNRYVGDARGFRFWAEDPAQKEVFQMGDRIPNHRVLAFNVVLPPDATTGILLKNSLPVYKWKGRTGQFYCDQPGVYRVEVKRKKRAFIYSNPIVIEA